MSARTTTAPVICLATLCLLTASALAGCGSGSSAATPGTGSDTTSGTVSATRTPPPHTPVAAGDLRVGQSAELGNLRTTVTAAGRGTTYAGKVTFYVTVTLENEGSQPIPFDQADWRLELAGGTGGADKPFMQSDSLGSGVLAPGSIKTGVVHYICPREVSKIMFTPSSSTGDTAAWIFQ
jgi:hypothetical protein